MDSITSRRLPEVDILQVLRDASDVWEELRGQTIFVTGATGFVGRWMLSSLQAADRSYGLGVRVVALSRYPERFRREHPHLGAWPALTWKRGSVATLGPEVLEGRVDLAIHLATEADLGATLADPSAATEVIAGGTLRTLQVASRAGARRILFTSSGSVYGPQPSGLLSFSEDWPLPAHAPGARDARGIGAEGKRLAEAHCTDFFQRRAIDTVIARCFSFSGPGIPLSGKFAFGNFLRDALAGRRVAVKGDGTTVRSYLYGSDLSSWLWRLLLRGTAGRTYNVGSEHALSLMDLAEMVARELGAPGVDIGQARRPGEPTDRYVPSTLRARTELGLRESVGIHAAIRKTADWLCD